METNNPGKYEFIKEILESEDFLKEYSKYNSVNKRDNITNFLDNIETNKKYYRMNINKNKKYVVNRHTTVCERSCQPAPNHRGVVTCPPCPTPQGGCDQDHIKWTIPTTMILYILGGIGSTSCYYIGTVTFGLDFRLFFLLNSSLWGFLNYIGQREIAFKEVNTFAPLGNE